MNLGHDDGQIKTLNWEPLSPKIDKIIQNHADYFTHYALYYGRRFRTLNVLDEGTREYLAIEIDTSLPAARVIRVLEHLKLTRRLPKQIRVDNGPELILVNLLNYCDENNVQLIHIQAGKPQQNGFIERFNGSFRRGFLNAYLFNSLSQVREMAWL